jgi:hypothetical protein
MHAIRRGLAVVAVIGALSSPALARADVVLDWNAIAVSTMLAQTPAPNPFSQARFMAITQLAVFEAVNAIDRRYEPYLGTIIAPAGASADAAAIAAYHHVLRNYFPASAATLDGLRASALAAIPDGPAKTDGISVGESAAAAMIQARLNDGSAPPEFYMPQSADPGEWQLTPSCPPAGGTLLHWRNVTPFGVPDVEPFIAPPPPPLRSREYAEHYIYVMKYGGINSTRRPPDRTDVARFYAATSPAGLLNSAARQASMAQGRSMAWNARALALLNMSSNDALIASFATKYRYNFWRPETAIRAGDTDGNERTEADPTWVPLIVTPCFPSYGSNHAAGTNGGAEILRRLYGDRGHAITLSNPAVPGVVLQYRSFTAICLDVDDARVFGGIHFPFDQQAGTKMGVKVATYIYTHHLKKKRH